MKTNQMLRGKKTMFLFYTFFRHHVFHCGAVMIPKDAKPSIFHGQTAPNVVHIIGVSMENVYHETVKP